MSPFQLSSSAQHTTVDTWMLRALKFQLQFCSIVVYLEKVSTQHTY